MFENMFTTMVFIFRYDGGSIVRRSINIGEPVVYVSINYRSVHLPSSTSRACSHMRLQVKRYASSSARGAFYSIFVCLTFRVYSSSVFGFLGGKEVKAAGIGNLGIQDRKLLFWFENGF